MRQLIIVMLLSLSICSFPAVAGNTAAGAASGYKQADAAATLSLQQAIDKVLAYNPGLKAADYDIAAANSRIQTARLPTPYTGSIELENFAGSGFYSGGEALETTLRLSRVLEAGNKSDLRGDLSHNKAVLLRNETEARRLDLLADTAKLFLEVITRQQRVVNANEAIAIAERSRQVVNKRVSAGRSPRAESGRAEIAQARLQLKLDHANHMLESTRLKLATLWGDKQAAFSFANADLYAIEELKPFNTLVSMLENNPDLARFATEKRLAVSRSLLAGSASDPDVEISGGLRHFNFSDDVALVLSVNIPFGTTTRARSGIAEAEMQALREPYLYQQKWLALYAILFELHQEAGHAVSAVSSLRKTIIPQAEQMLHEYEQGYASGRYSFLELTEMQQLLLDSKLELVVAAADYHRYLIEIDRLTGAGLLAGDVP